MAGTRKNILILCTVLTLGLIRVPFLKLAARRACSATVRLLLRLRSQPYVAGQNHVTLVISPHQDDDVLGCGGLIARKRFDGHAVHVVYITDGGASHEGHPVMNREAVVKLRETEARAALGKLGVETSAVHFLGAPDGTLAGLSAEQTALLSDRLCETIKRLRPGEIFTPYRRDGSSEHEAAFGLVTNALGSLPFQARLYEYPVWAWWNPLLLVRPYFTARRVVRLQFKEGGLLKKDALACHRSQFEPVAPWTSPVIAPAFVSFFTRDEEFYFEI